MDSTSDLNELYNELSLDELYDELSRQKNSKRGLFSETLYNAVFTAIKTDLANYGVTVNKAMTMYDEFSISIKPPETLFPNLRNSWAIDARPTYICYSRCGDPDKAFDEYMYFMVTTCKQVLDRLNFLDFLDRNFQKLSSLGYIVDTVDFNYAINGSHEHHTSFVSITDLRVLGERRDFRSVVIGDDYQEFIASVKVRDVSTMLAKRRKIYGDCDVEISFKKTFTDSYCIIASVYRHNGILGAQYSYTVDDDVIPKLDYLSRENNPKVFSEYFPDDATTTQQS